MSPRKAAKKAAYQASLTQARSVDTVWVDEAVTPRFVEQELQQAQEQDKANEERIEAAVTAARDRAARVGLGNRGRIRAGQRAMAKEQRRIAKERGL